MSEGSKEKHAQHSKASVLVAILGGIGLLAVIGFVAYKVKKSIASSKVEETFVDSSSSPIKKQAADGNAKPKVHLSDSVKAATFFAKYFKKDSVPSHYPKFLLEAFTGYTFGDYMYIKDLNLAAIPETIETIEGNNKETILQLGHYYKGIVGIITNDSTMAASNLQWPLTKGSHEMATKARWYMALFHIRNARFEKASYLLETVSYSSFKEYKEQAKLLLEELKSK